MTITSWLFGLLLMTSTLIYWLLPNSYRNHFLLGIGMLFVFYSSPKTLFLLFSLSTMIYFLSNYTPVKRFYLILRISFIIFVLAYFKYQPLLIELLQKTGIPEINYSFLTNDLILPLGISFFTFKLIHYIIDAFKGRTGNASYLQFLSYMFFFPIQTSGPIERWQNFSKQTQDLSNLKWEFITEGISRIIIGLFKKLVLAETFAIYANKLTLMGLSSTIYWISVYAYALQIYFDFSGYSDIAIGSSRLFSFKFMENFNYPYLKRNLSLFWKNWHISLTSWFIEYVFIPLGGSRVKLSRNIVNIFVVMALTGLWHGSSIHFIAWGIYHAIGLAVVRLYTKFAANKLSAEWTNSKTAAALSTILTFNFVAVGWVFFATDFEQSIYVIKKLLFFGEGTI